ncbi:M48 family metallopeptidase [Paenibacillus aurantiacus]|uniref:M48 family metallopeptidase n=1 Tax=Paenibacillus aurantiacus TaxID=1936118 RepID=A0ABV5KT04_9BACL
MTSKTAATPHMQESEICPACDSRIPHYPQFTTWCECGWNLRPYQPDEGTNHSARKQAAAGNRKGERMLQEMKDVTSRSLSAPAWKNKIALYLCASLIHLATLAMLGIGIWLIVANVFHAPLLSGIGVLLLVITFLSFPSLGRIDRRTLLDREQFPALYALADRIADSLGAKRVHGLQISEAFNATYTETGWGRKSIVTLGLPLMTILTPEEKVALIGHEIAHGANGDLTRGLFVNTAFRAAAQWYRYLTPDRDGGGILAQLTELTMRGLSQIPFALLRILSRLSHDDQQRSEYYADALASRASGVQGQVGLTRKLHIAESFYSCVQRHVLQKQEGDLMRIWQSYAERIPAREFDRLDRVQRLTGSRLDHTHPPTPYRLELLHALPPSLPAVTVGPEEHDAICLELAAFHEAVNALLKDELINRLYA